MACLNFEVGDVAVFIGDRSEPGTANIYPGEKVVVTRLITPQEYGREEKMSHYEIVPENDREDFWRADDTELKKVDA